MKNLHKIILLLVASSLLMLNACKDDDQPEPQEYGTFNLTFDHVWGMNQQEFNLNTWLKQPKTGDSLNFTTFKYYISNLQLQKEDGSWWTEDESYYLVEVDKEGGNTLTIDNVPVGNYTALKFVHGVDSTRNVSGAQEGALSVLNGMFWSWNSGYIMTKIEGESPQADDGTFAFHIGGFSGENNVVTEREASFGSEVLSVQASATPTLKMVANPARFWHSTGSLTETVDKIHMPSEMTTQMGIDFYTWTSFKGIE
jgi:hypothetical protein